MAQQGNKSFCHLRVGAELRSKSHCTVLVIEHIELLCVWQC